MSNLTWSDKYGLAAALALVLMVLINSAVLMLALSVAGIGAGIWVMRQGEARRVAFVALAAFVLAAAFAIYGLVLAA